ncbi:Nucleotide-binding universal stress protein, UspA family [Halogranum amylolyticum]|uniref:Nucleotide-binding universal stress protein, UspA family n=1 Tax=Halogranum amylolyticum TaxID=660520 RepID=A0A1H8SK53_9EURY|nr:universal stress protein [Halogranum amylolyticum]SEO78573.1 Nucleotide-binding universal stress protein, UspA family [Halogranum amylolyticum]
MISRVLVPIDDSEMAERALRYALEAHPDAAITVIHVVGEPSTMLGGATSIALADDIEAAAEEHARDVLDRAEAVAAEYDIEVDTAVEMGHPARAIVGRAGDFDTVVIGSHGGSLADRLFIGNVARTVFRRSPVPVTVVR